MFINFTIHLYIIKIDIVRQTFLIYNKLFVYFRNYYQIAKDRGLRFGVVYYHTQDLPNHVYREEGIQGEVLDLLRTTCRGCGRILIPQDKIKKHLGELEKISLEIGPEDRRKRIAEIIATLRTITKCPHCKEKIEVPKKVEEVIKVSKEDYLSILLDFIQSWRSIRSVCKFLKKDEKYVRELVEKYRKYFYIKGSRIYRRK